MFSGQGFLLIWISDTMAEISRQDASRECKSKLCHSPPDSIVRMDPKRAWTQRVPIQLRGTPWGSNRTGTVFFNMPLL